MHYFLLALAALVATPSQATVHCSGSLAGLRALLADAEFPLRWIEIGMDDGRPLLLSIAERNDALRLTFTKTDRGVWAEGPITLCKHGPEIKLRLDATQVRLGPAAPWILRHTFGQGTELTLVRTAHSRLSVSTLGWSGTFVPMVEVATR